MTREPAFTPFAGTCHHGGTASPATVSRPAVRGAWRGAAILISLAAIPAGQPAMAAVGAMGAGSDATHALFTWELIYVGGVLVNLAVGISAIVATWAGLRARKDTQRREIVFGDQYVTRQEVQSHQSEIERRITKLESAVSSLDERGRTSMHTLEAVMDEKVTRIHERLDGVDTKISALPHQIVALLVNTRQLNAPIPHEHPH